MREAGTYGACRGPVPGGCRSRLPRRPRSSSSMARLYRRNTSSGVSRSMASIFWRWVTRVVMGGVSGKAAVDGSTRDTIRLPAPCVTSSMRSEIQTRPRGASHWKMHTARTACRPSRSVASIRQTPSGVVADPAVPAATRVRRWCDRPAAARTAGRPVSRSRSGRGSTLADMTEALRSSRPGERQRRRPAGPQPPRRAAAAAARVGRAVSARHRGSTKNCG